MTIPALEVTGLVRAFGGIRAIDGVTLAVPAGSVTALIGPNGSGKTTLFNLITNLYRPDAGGVRLFGEPLTGAADWQVAARGLVRTFQTARVFPGMTAFENVLAGAHLRQRSTPLSQMLWLGRARHEERALAERAEAMLELAGLGGFRDTAATDLPMGAQKLLEVIRALMARPRLLLLDEPAAGLNDGETAELAMLLCAVRDSGVTLLVVEHNMSLVMGVADQVIVLDAGAVIARGTPAEIQRNPRVIEAYIGQAEGTA
ncbi:MAG TPA: ABC transporter ATP-binding protein [Stellaceae bacterium]|nr:ABC transporter ATP-binding protein [Stellaceae bacterium]